MMPIINQRLVSRLGRSLPLPWYEPFRQGAQKFRHGTAARNICIVVLKLGARVYRGHLAGKLAEIRPLDRVDLSFQSTDSMVMDAVFWFGVRGYEGRTAEIWVDLCRTASRVLEIGGNVGLFTVIGAKACDGRYVTVEPVPRVAAILRTNVERNGLTNVIIHLAAAVAGKTERDVAVNVPDEGRFAPVGSHLVDDVEMRGRNTLQRLVVKGIPINRLIVDCDLVKIDAEGIEAELLMSAREYILARRPTIMIEVLQDSARLGQYIRTLSREAGYGIYVIPEYGRPDIVMVHPDHFSSEVPSMHRSKDVVLSIDPIEPRVRTAPDEV